MAQSEQRAETRGVAQARLAIAIWMGAAILAGVSIILQQTSEARIYDRILREAWQELKPLYSDVGTKYDPSSPCSIEEFGARLRALVAPLH